MPYLPSLVGFIISFLAGYYLNAYAPFFLPVPFLPESEVVVLLTKMENWDGTNVHIESGVIYLLNAENQWFIVASEEGNEELDERLRLFEFQYPLRATNTEHQILMTAKNIGRLTANELAIDLQSTGKLRIVDPDRKLRKNECSIATRNPGCYVEAGQIGPNDSLSFVIISDDEHVKPIIKVDGEIYNESFIEKHFYVMPFPVAPLQRNGAIIPAPPTTNTDCLYFLDENNEWQGMASPPCIFSVIKV